jgi:hypothetical protein
MVDDSEAIPDPSTVEAIIADADYRDGVHVMVPVPATAFALAATG